MQRAGALNPENEEFLAVNLAGVTQLPDPSASGLGLISQPHGYYLRRFLAKEPNISQSRVGLADLT
jgi:hypothetical protein